MRCLQEMLVSFFNSAQLLALVFHGLLPKILIYDYDNLFVLFDFEVNSNCKYFMCNKHDKGDIING